ncbi:bZIP transcription factor 44-like [Silene latifolia]|uniref:bZIP transcription factor 44-like n=1 Tax=Silene latifolia TaxID=37657 RepID=UPI003D76EE13
MATSSGNTTSSSNFEGEQQQNVVILDERKRKRMTSNRESARRSRMKKQQHVDNLTTQIAQLKRENNQIGQTIDFTTQQFLNVESQNCVLRAQMNELSQRLESLNGMINDMNALNGVGALENDCLDLGGFGDDLGDFGIMNHGYFGNFGHNIGGGNNSPWDLGYLNQPIQY